MSLVRIDRTHGFKIIDCVREFLAGRLSYVAALNRLDMNPSEFDGLVVDVIHNHINREGRKARRNCG